MEIIWSYTFGGSRDDSANSIAKTKDGDYIISTPQEFEQKKERSIKANLKINNIK